MMMVSRVRVGDQVAEHVAAVHRVGGHLGRAEPAESEPRVERHRRSSGASSRRARPARCRPAGRRRPSGGWSRAARGASLECPSTSCMAIASGSSRASFASRCGSTYSRSSIRVPPVSDRRVNRRSRECTFPAWSTTRACSPISRPRRPTSTPSSHGIDDTQWTTPTPAAGWDVRDSIAHLRRERGPRRARAERRRRVRRPPRGDARGLRGTEDSMVAARAAPAPGAEVLAWWRAERERVLSGLGVPRSR